MPIVRMTVKYVNAPKDGKKRGSIKGTDDSFIGAFPDKLAMFEPGKTYDIEVSETESNGVTYRNVKSATPVDVPISPAASTNGSGSYRPTCPTDAKRMFVCAQLSALIRSGEVKNDKRQLWETTQMLCSLWDHSFGEASTFHASDAGKQARG